MACVALGDDVFGECRPCERAFVAVAGGESFSIGVTTEGEVVGWGSAFYGELGVQPTDDDDEAPQPRVRTLPTAIATPTKCSSIACGLHHVLTLSTNGEVFAWGRNAHGETAQSPSKTAYCSRPIKVEFSTSEEMRIVAVAAGGAHSLALESTGAVWSWGDNTYGQMGIGTTSPSECTPHRVTLEHPAPVQSMAAGYAHSAMIARDGSVWTCGWGLYHQLGHGTTENCDTAMLVDALEGIDGGMCAVACGTWHTAAISAQGDVYTWGWGPDGQLGPNQGPSAVQPSVVDTIDEYFAQEDEGHRAVGVACGARFTVVVSREGKLFSWGRNAATMSSSAPTSRSIKALAAGHSHALVLIKT